MANCFGLKTLYQYLHVPFLQLKANTLRQQLAATQRELDHARRARRTRARAQHARALFHRSLSFARHLTFCSTRRDRAATTCAAR